MGVEIVVDKACEEDEIMFDKVKPVWRVNSGNGIPSDFGGLSYVLIDGELHKVSRVRYIGEEHLWDLNGAYTDILCYRTNRTRKAKYTKIQCVICCGSGVSGSPAPMRTALYMPEPESGSRWSACIKCHHCNGKGYKLEKINA